MSISRRNFLGGMTGCAAALWSYRPLGCDSAGPLAVRRFDCVVLDLNSGCVLPESLQGYQAALLGGHNLLPRAVFDLRRRCQIVIVPGVGAMDHATASTLSDLLRAGSNVLLESGAAFLSPAEFTDHQRMLQRHFDIAVGSPVDLWDVNPADDAVAARRLGRRPGKKRGSHASIPYVSYLWPHETKVRDFSRAIPVSAGAGDVIAKVGALPVALKKRVAQGTLIFLGSPLGPALRAGDPEALSWLRLVASL
jgi:hypothetical protein